MTWSLLGGLMPPAADAAKENKVKSTKNSGDSGNCSEAEEGQNTNRAIELEFQLTQSLLSQVKANEDNRDANSGKQAYKDLRRMGFVINGETIDKECILGLYGKNNYLIQNGSEDYRPFAKQVFTEMFNYAKAEVPNDHILEELITSCNQAGYEFVMCGQIQPIFSKYSLISAIPEKTISLCCDSAESVNVEYSDTIVIKNQDPDQVEQYKSDSKLEFTLKSQNDKVEYENGKVTLTIPEELKNYEADGKSLLDDINEHFKNYEKEFVIVSENLALDKLVDIVNKAKNGDYTNLDEVMGNIKKDDIPINPNLKDLKDFCSQQLNLTAQTDHESVRKVLIEKIYTKENGTVKKLVLLAIAANDTLVERCVKMHEGILFTQDEDLDRLLLGAGGQGYIKALLEFLEEKQSRVLSWNNICEKLKRASSIGNQECVEAILNRFEDTESRDPAISSKLLHYAVEKGDYDLVDSLIKNGADVNIQDRNNKTALHYAVSSYGDIQNVNKMVMLLVESGAKIDTQDSDGKTALHYAAASNKDEIVRLLLKEGANEEIKDKSGKTFLGMVASETKSFLLNVLHPGGLLHHTAKEGNIDRAKRLLAKGKDVNAKNSYCESPLSVAIQNNCLEIVKLFLEERAKIGKEEVNKAIGAGNLEVIELLVSKDAVITEKVVQYAQNVYEQYEKEGVYIPKYPGGMRGERQARTGILNFLKGNLVNETAASSQLSSQKPKSTDSQRPQENVVDRGKNIMDNGKASKKELVSNNYEEGEMGKKKPLSQPIQEEVNSLLTKESIGLKEKLENIVKTEDYKKVLGYIKSNHSDHEEAIKILKGIKKQKDLQGKNGSLSNPQNQSTAVVECNQQNSPSHSSDGPVNNNENSESSSGLVELPESNENVTDSDSSEYVKVSSLSSSNSSSPVEEIENIPVFEENGQQGVQSKSLVDSDGEHNKDVFKNNNDRQEDPLAPTSTNKNSEKAPDPILTPAPPPNPNPVPGAPVLTSVPPVASESSATLSSPQSVPPENSEQVQDNSKQPSKNDVVPRSTKSSKWPIVATWVFAVAGVLAGAAASAAYFAFGASLLVTGITAGIGVCCLVAAIIIHKSPSSSLAEANAEVVVDNVSAVTAG